MSAERLSKRLRLAIRNSLISAAVGGFFAGLMPTVSAQDETRKDPSSMVQTAFAPGVIRVIPPAADPKETFDGPLELTPLLNAYPELAWEAKTFPDNTPHYDPRSRTIVEMARQAILRREIYCLEFAFKPLRQLFIDVPRPDGRMQRKLVWYMVYRVRYRGGDLRPAIDKVAGAPVYRRVEAVSYQSRRFFPLLIMDNQVTGKSYLDTILPTAKRKIAIREQISGPLYNSVEISSKSIPLSTDEDAPGLWGIATWVDVDPNTDFLSVNVYGLTNAFDSEGLEPDSPYRRKCLSLNFYRPGDTVAQTDDETRFGVPAFKDEAEQDYILKQYGLSERLDYRWIFR